MGRAGADDLRSGPTFDQIIRGQASHTTGFDYLRVGLALGVLFVHVAVIADHEFWVALWTTWFGPIERSILPAFFILSGFLVSGSLVRNSVPKFVALRVVRIIPALAVEVTLSALLIGLSFTTLSWSDYFRAPEFGSYFLNIIGDIHFTLPGVFEGRKLNEQLWTIPYEFECYFILVALSIVGIVRRRDILAVILLSGVVTVTAMALYMDLIHEGWNVPPRVMVIAFLFGVAFYLHKDNIPHSRPLFFGCLAATYFCLYIPNLVYLAMAPLTYVTIYVGAMRLPKIPFGDLSYGTYLFHYPIAVCIHELSGHTLSWPLLLPATIATTAIFAALSWHYVEKPILDRKARLLAAVDFASRWLAGRIPRKLSASA